MLGFGVSVMVCWKLVRDRVGEELLGRSDVRVYRVGGEEYEALLRAKIVEEALELAGSGDVGEVADLFEAVYAWLRARGVGLEEVEAVRERKRKERGGFDGGYVVVWLRGCGGDG